MQLQALRDKPELHEDFFYKKVAARQDQYFNHHH